VGGSERERGSEREGGREDLMRKRKLKRTCKRLVGGVLFGGVLLRCPLEGDSLLFVSPL
jgi:hypothetical protein